jgi:hypothetical protein
VPFRTQLNDLIADNADTQGIFEGSFAKKLFFTPAD